MSKSKNIHGSLVECKCVGCGKKFVPAPYHIYRIYKGLYCTYKTVWSGRKNDTTRSVRLEKAEGETSYDRGKGYSAYQRTSQGEAEP